MSIAVAVALFATFASPALADPDPSSELRFDLEGAAGLAVEDPAEPGEGSNLVVVEPGGETRDAIISGDATASRILIAPDDRVYVLFSERMNLSDTSSPSADGCLLAEIDLDSELPRCVDDSLDQVIWDYGVAANPAIQFDAKGAIYYLGEASGKTVLRRHHNGVTTNLITDQIRVWDFLVTPDGNVYLNGTTTSTGAEWLRRISPTGGIQTVVDRHGTFLKRFADGNIYFGATSRSRVLTGVHRFLTSSLQLDPKAWIGGDVNDDISKDSHFPLTTLCSGDDYNKRYGFCAGNGASVGDSFGGYVIAGQAGNGILAQYYPEPLFPETAVKSVSLGVGVKDGIVLAGKNEANRYLLTHLNLVSGTETELIGPANEIEIYHLNYIPAENKVMFDGLRFSDGKYVLGEVTLSGAPAGANPAGMHQAGTARASASKRVSLTPVNSTKWEDFQTFGGEVTPPPLRRPKRPDNRPPAHVPKAKRAAMPAGLQISQARIKNRRLVVRGSLDRTAAGQRLELRFRAKARQIILRPRVRANGRFAVTRRLGGPLRNVTGGRLQVKFRGTARLRAAQERLWVARRPVNLRLIRIRYRGGRVEVAGKIDRRARKPVRILLEFVRADGRPAQVAKQARVDRKGRFQTQLRVGPAAGTGAWLSASHPGQGPLHGQRTGRMIRR